ncbi:MAG: hypothetical protein GY803_32370, partial [Chloroflexi bacterium]|nr:hypothetical protein [Chloroflexota bacterium]
QEARLVWLVQMITDQCDDPQADPQTCARTDTLDVIHIYEESWTLTGLSVSEEHGLDVALLYEDPAQDLDLFVDDDLWQVSWNLNNTFLRGRDCDTMIGDQCQGDGSRDVTINNMAAQINSWSGGSSTVQVTTFTNYAHQGYLADIGMTQTAVTLDTHFTPYATETNPTLLFAQEAASRSLNLDQAVTSFTNAVTLDLDPATVKEVVTAGLKWAPYHYVNGEWQTYDLAEYLTLLEYNLSQNYSFMADVVTAQIEEKEGKLLWGQIYYTALYGGTVSSVEQDGALLWVPEIDVLSEDDYDANWSGGGTGLAAVADKYADQFSLLISSVRTTHKTSGKWGKFYRAFNASSFDIRIGRELLLVQKMSGFTVRATMALTAVAGTFIITGLITGEDTVAQVGVVIATVGALIIESTRLAMLVTQARAAVTASAGAANTIKNIANVAKTARSLAIATNLLALTLIWGLFVFQLSTGAFEVGSNEFNQSLALTIAGTIVLLLFIALEFIPVIGPFIVILLSVIDLILALFGETGFSGWLTETIADLLYDVDYLLVNMDDPDRLDITLDTVNLLNDDDGFTVGNSVNYVLGVTNTLRFDSQFSYLEAYQAVFRYFLQTDDTPQHDGLAPNDMLGQWTVLSNSRLQTAVTTTLSSPIPLADIGSGVNRSLDGHLYLIESYVQPYEGCWLLFGFDVDCTWYFNNASNPLNIGESTIYDILPDTIGEFVSLSWNRNGALSFPIRRDADADGLLSQARGGADPDDNTVDTDGD